MGLELMTVGGGCFWCTEAIFDHIKGVKKVVSGYSGGTVPGVPTYREVCSGLSGHAEVIQLSFNPSVISYQDLLIVFLTTHNPTTLHKQGADWGTQYRSVIFYHNEQQHKIAQRVLQEMAPYFEDPIVTELTPLTMFHPAEAQHQNFYTSNPNSGYCSAVINPKLVKLREMHAEKLK